MLEAGPAPSCFKEGQSSSLAHYIYIYIFKHSFLIEFNIDLDSQQQKAPSFLILNKLFKSAVK